MAYVTTLPLEYQALMKAPSGKKSHRCAVCGRWLPYRSEAIAGPAIEEHHMVFRSAAKVFDSVTGKEIRKPTVWLCGMGNNLHDADGRTLCHGAAHHRLLHFYWNEDERQLEYLFTDYPTKYCRALDRDGWSPVGVKPYSMCGLLAESYAGGAVEIPY